MLTLLNNLYESLDGYKTHILAVFGIAVALVGHFWGPVTIGNVSIPHIDSNAMWAVIWNGGLFSALHAKNS